jgi:hypothetical protein
MAKQAVSETAEDAGGLSDAVRTALGNSAVRFKTDADVAKSYLEVEHAYRTNPRIPKKGEDKAQWDATWTALGRPESHDKYTLPEKGMAKDLGLALRGTAWEYGVTQDAFVAMLKVVDELEGGRAKERQKVLDSLPPDVKAAAERARSRLAANGDGLQVGDDPTSLQLLAKLGGFMAGEQMMADASFQGPRKQAPHRGREIVARLNAIVADPKFLARGSESIALHKENMALREELHQLGFHGADDPKLMK